MDGDEGDLKAADEEADSQEHIARMTEGLGEPHRAMSSPTGRATATRRRRLPWHPAEAPSGMIRSTSAPISISAVCQPKATMKAWPKGAKMNCPSEPAAVAMPKAQERFSGGTSRPKAAMTSVKDVVAMPTPAITPPVRIHETRRIREGHQGDAGRIDQRADDQYPRRAVFVGKAAGDRLENAPGEILDRHGEAIGLAMPLMGLGDRIGEETHGGAGAERNDGDECSRRR